MSASKHNPLLRTMGVADFDHYMHVPAVTETSLSADKSYRKTRSPSNPLRPELVTMRGSIACCTTLNQLTASQWHSFVPAWASNTRKHFQTLQQSDIWRQIMLCRQGENQLNWVSCGAYGESHATWEIGYVWKGLGRRQSWPSRKHSHGSEKSEVLLVNQFCSKSFKWRGWGTPRKCQVWHTREQPC